MKVLSESAADGPVGAPAAAVEAPVCEAGGVGNCSGFGACVVDMRVLLSLDCLPRREAAPKQVSARRGGRSLRDVDSVVPEPVPAPFGGQ